MSSERDEIAASVRKEVNAVLDAAERTLALIGEHNTELGFGVRKVDEGEREICVALNTVLESLGRLEEEPVEMGIGLQEAIVRLTLELVERDLPICSPSVTHSRFIAPDDPDPSSGRPSSWPSAPEG